MAYLLSDEYADFLRSLKNTATSDTAPASQREPVITRISPVKITSDWTNNNEEESDEEKPGAWTAKARRLWWNGSQYDVADWNPDEITLYDPCATEKPGYLPGQRVYAIYRGRWELVAAVQTYFEGTIESESNGVYSVLLYKNKEQDTFEEPIEATTLYLESDEILENDTEVGVTWTPMYGYRITHCEI